MRLLRLSCAVAALSTSKLISTCVRCEDDGTTLRERSRVAAAKQILHTHRKQFVWRSGKEFFDEYSITEELGAGGYGQVFLAVHKTTGVSRAVKRVKRDNEEADKALQKELATMQRLLGCPQPQCTVNPTPTSHHCLRFWSDLTLPNRRCPHVVNVLGGFADDNHRYMVLELCFGLDLIDSIVEELSADPSSSDQTPAQMHPNVSHVSAVFREMVTAVDEVHQKGVAHMDIKPENFIHVSTNGRQHHLHADDTVHEALPHVKLLDFGLAWNTAMQSSVEDGTALGCTQYLAPEMFGRHDNVDPQACDITIGNL